MTRGGNYPAGWKSPKTRLTTNLWSGIPPAGGDVPAQVQGCTYSRSPTGRPAPHRASYFKVSTLKALKLDQHHKVPVKACFLIFFFSFSWRLPSNYCNGSTQTEGWQGGGPAFTLNLSRSCTQSPGSQPSIVLGVTLNLKTISLRRASLQLSNHNT